MKEEHDKRAATIKQSQGICTCGLKEALEQYDQLLLETEQGYNYLMSVNPAKLTVESALKAFGYDENGMKND